MTTDLNTAVAKLVERDGRFQALLDELSTALTDLVSAAETDRGEAMAKHLCEALKALRIEAPPVNVTLPEIRPVVHVVQPAKATFSVDIQYSGGLPRSMKITRS